MTQSKAKTKTQPKTLSKVVLDTQTGVDNFPSSVEMALQQMQQYIEMEAQNGYYYGGYISRNIGGELRNFYVFYKYPQT